MPKTIDIKDLTARNPKVDAKRLRERLAASKKLGQGRRYRYNLVSPFAGRLHRNAKATVKD